ncbi:3-oxo-5a-steroid 4- dehydrogenase [Coemansia sp. RSA 989]|nr:3-oxo-5-alpha-steroid 4-dehydrogenase-domain-containing protein [Coemansia mojavensis]KAJ1740668.1 3-oxo-5a-steroid 4- dehydrogenase [Coemansia sp. RSA 1086]KAJ1749259.1 3-oxo-5a-steroid 4- dehydrogenase [Coemansia sp. RSA 1821]KAJ1864424.1 3-oxo-5a-steroid 4- dehydrogenase [Coemansia sp. RSA 989]KAJ1871114.1 3-oxo-5a-steroid 4- dehydrogenase [Coemansia sp. RSA 990]KAJ2668958.1 3-oxo-5a-steroid 4- dehydrogenase [Coemansia sp. RSA 1085]
MHIRIEKRSSSAAGASGKPKPLLEVEVDDSATVDELKSAIHKHAKKLYPDRQRLTTADKSVLKPGESLSKHGIGDGSVIFLKDLGPQIGWRAVFYIEYLGPIIFHYFIYNFSELIYGHAVEHSTVQRYAYILTMGHFIKRELETAFVHRFSNGTMPLLNLFKNSGHYHILSGLNLAYWLYSPATAKGTLQAAKLGNPSMLLLYSGIFLFAEVSNLITHITLRNLRPPGTRIRRIPTGYGFNLVSVPNYFFEIIAWTAFTCMTRSLAALLFLVVATAQMYVWAVKKHKQYKREFPDYPKSRKALFPFIL